MGRTSMFPTFRRITTKRGEDGRSVLAEDIPVEIDAIGLADFWVTNATPARCDEFYGFGAQKARLEPPPCGTVFRYFVIPPPGDISTQAYNNAGKDIVAAQHGPHCPGDTPGQPISAATPTIHLVTPLPKNDSS